jgi:hypothetical protein
MLLLPFYKGKLETGYKTWQMRSKEPGFEISIFVLKLGTMLPIKA